MIYFNWGLITLQYCSVFCHTLLLISNGCTCVPHPEVPSQLPPYPIPPGHPSALALNILSHASNLDWLSISPMEIYMFQCYSLKSSHPFLLLQIQKSVLYICVSYAALQVGLLVLSFWIPYICINIQYFSFFLWLTSLSIIGSRLIHLISTDSNALLFIA